MCVDDKLERLKQRLHELGSVVIAFSGGVDSSFLVKIAHDVLGDRVLAVTARSFTYPERECEEAVQFAAKRFIPHTTIVSEELEVEGFSDNPKNRCYLCKKELFTKMRSIADEKGYRAVAEGSNVDDLSDYRPGLRAIRECGIESPLKDAGLTKADIRALSKKMGLETWDKPAYACLSSRFPYGQMITKEKLRMVEQAEQILIDMGFTGVRVRYHGEVARIETKEESLARFVDPKLSYPIYEMFKKLGFVYVALDLIGYRTGSMNESLSTTEREENG